MLAVSSLTTEKWPPNPTSIANDYRPCLDTVLGHDGASDLNLFDFNGVCFKGSTDFDSIRSQNLVDSAPSSNLQTAG